MEKSRTTSSNIIRINQEIVNRIIEDIDTVVSGWKRNLREKTSTHEHIYTDQECLDFIVDLKLELSEYGKKGHDY
jgi:hypothetical protein